MSARLWAETSCMERALAWSAPSRLCVAPQRRGEKYNASVSSPEGQRDATLLLFAAANGNQAAADRLLPLVFDKLRRAAQRQLANARPGHTLSATGLVHEVCLKLAGPREVDWAGRGHFYAAAAEVMRRIRASR